MTDPGKIKPTDEQINRACAEACGWQWFHNPRSGIEIDRAGQLVKPDIASEWKFWQPCSAASLYVHQTYISDYCTDRNALAELWARVQQEHDSKPFGYQTAKGFFLAELLSRMTETGIGRTQELWYMHTVPPRCVCIAFLRALRQWPQEWVTEEVTR